MEAHQGGTKTSDLRRTVGGPVFHNFRFTKTTYLCIL
jgi:hypothetical protein